LQGPCPRPRFPAMALSTRRLPFLCGVPVSPVPRSQRYYEGATTSHPRIHGRLFGLLPLPTGYLHIRARRSAPARSEDIFRARALGHPVAPSAGFELRGREWDLSGLQAIRPVPLLHSSTPVEPMYPRHTGYIDAAPATHTAKASAIADFGADSCSFGTC